MCVVILKGAINYKVNQTNTKIEKKENEFLEQLFKFKMNKKKPKRTKNKDKIKIYSR